MTQQATSSPNGAVIQPLRAKNRKKRNRFNIEHYAENSSVSAANTMDFSVTSASPAKNGEGNKPPNPAKKRRKNKKIKTQNEGSTEIVKPVLIVKGPEDYSSNWKKLQKIIAKEDKKTALNKPSTRAAKVKHNNNKDTATKSRKKYHKNDSVESTETKMEYQKDAAEESENLDIWFDNVDPILLEETHVQKNKKPGILKNSKKTSSNTLVKEGSFDGVTKTVAMDCEMVGVGMNGKDSILARVSLVNHYGKVLYDKFVKPTEEVVDYRTPVSGIRPGDIENGCEFYTVQKEVAELLEGHILVGHSVHNDLRMLFLSHPRSQIRDTAKYKGFVRQFGGRTPSLKKLVERFLGVQIQQGEHSSVQDAQAAMRLYTMHRKEWEKSRTNKYRQRHKGKINATLDKEKHLPGDAQGE